MKIGLFTDTFEQPNGVAEHVKNIAERFSENHDVIVYTGSGSSSSYKVINLPHYSFPLQGEYEYISTRECVVDEDIDVAHAHSPYCTHRLAFRTRKPVVTTTHTIPQHMLDYLHLRFLTPLAWRYLIRIHNRSDHVICQTESTKRLFLERGLKKPASVISAGVDVSRFQKGDPKKFREKYGIDGDFVLSTSRLSPEKRVDWTLKACEELGIQCVATSTGPLLKKLRKDYPSVKFLGRIPFKEICDAYSAARILSISSRVETEGVVVNEAMASKLPLLAPRLPCIADSISDGENGLLFVTYDELKSKMKMLWDDGKLRKKLSSRAFKDVKQKDYSIVTKKLLEVYESLV
ncbi:MAG: glycosyltransferase [archaeon]